MSVFERFDRDAYTEERGIELARAYAGEARDDAGRLMSLSKLHALDPSWFPPPWVIINWRETIPRFRLAMEQAERTRAFVMMEECIEIADDTERQAAQARNAMDARMRMAEAIDRRRFGKGPMGGQVEPNENPAEIAAELTDAQLKALARDGWVDRERGRLAIASDASAGSDPLAGGGDTAPSAD